MKISYYEAVLGVSDKDTNINLGVDKVKSELEEVLKANSVDFSMSLQKGGYVAENGSYVLEDSIRIILIGNRNEEEVLTLVNKIKKVYNQESILLVRKEIDQEYVGE